jgi:acyl carrier protein
MSSVADSLARANVLQAICENFDVVISESSLAEARNAIQYYKEMDELGNSLDELIARINDGLEEETYEFIRVPDEKGGRRIFPTEVSVRTSNQLLIYYSSTRRNGT